MAVDLHLRMLDTRRNDVERIQVARAVLELIAKDLRSAVEPITTDFSSLAAMAADAAASGSGSAAMDALGGDAGGGDAGGGDAGASIDDISAVGDDAASTASVDIAASESLPQVPGLYGNQFELQIDVGRLPRVDEMQRMVAASAMGPLQDIPSDVKTVAYYVHDPNSPTASGDFRDAAGKPQAGLVRRVLDRAVTLYAATNTNAGSLQSVGEIIAPEIASIQFEYYDGIEWLYEWDSEQSGGLPMAVRITIMMVPKDAATAADAGTSFSVNPMTLDAGLETYSLTVRLPTAVANESTAEDESGMEAVGL